MSAGRKEAGVFSHFSDLPGRWGKRERLPPPPLTAFLLLFLLPPQRCSGFKGVEKSKGLNLRLQRVLFLVSPHPHCEEELREVPVSSI